MERTHVRCYEVHARLAEGRVSAAKKNLKNDFGFRTAAAAYG
jgi:hypothetical protein